MACAFSRTSNIGEVLLYSISLQRSSDVIFIFNTTQKVYQEKRHLVLEWLYFKLVAADGGGVVVGGGSIDGDGSYVCPGVVAGPDCWFHAG